MLLIPAIDLKDGRCVRLRQGDLDDATVFSEDPAAMATHWLDTGRAAPAPGRPERRRRRQAAQRSQHQGHRGCGRRRRFRCRSAAASATSTPSSATSTTAFRYVIIGTAAVKNPGFLHDACGAFPASIIVGLDARDGKVATDGWSKLTRHDVLDLAKQVRGLRLRSRSSTPTSAATACCRASTSRPPCAWRSMCASRFSPPAASPASRTSKPCARNRRGRHRRRHPGAQHLRRHAEFPGRARPRATNWRSHERTHPARRQRRRPTR